jgi:transposase
MRKPMMIELTEGDRATLIRWVKSRAVGDKQSLRARIVLMTAEGCSTQAMMQTLKVSNPTLNLWRRRYLECGIEGLKQGKTRPSRVPPLPVEKVQEVLTLTLTGKPVAATHWSCRRMARQLKNR